MAVTPEQAIDTLDPRTPAEAKRHWMIDRLWLSACISFVLLAVLIGIVWLGDWPEALASQRLTILGWAICGFMLTHISVQVAFALGGPVGRWEARWGNRSLRAEDDETAARSAYDGAPK